MPSRMNENRRIVRDDIENEGPASGEVWNGPRSGLRSVGTERERAPESRSGRIAPETIDEAARVAAIVQSLAGHGATGTVRRPGAAPITLVPLSCDERGSVVWRAEEPLPAPPFFV